MPIAVMIRTSSFIRLHPAARTQLPRPLLDHFYAPGSWAKSRSIASLRPRRQSSGEGLYSQQHLLFSHRPLHKDGTLRKPVPTSLTITSRRYLTDRFANMTATRIDGNAIAKEIRERLSAKIKKSQETNPRYKPSLIIVQGTQDLTSPLNGLCH